MAKWQIILFSILHTAATVAAIVLVALLGGCLEAEVQNKPGRAIPCPELETALNDSLKGPYTFDVGEFTHIEDTAAPVNQPPSLMRDRARLVLATSPQGPQSTSCPSGTILRIEDTAVKNGATDTVETYECGIPGGFTMCDDRSTDTFHNFSVEKTTMPVPHAPQDPCDARYPNCQMNVTTFRFDKLVTEKDGEKLPLHILITTSNEVPFMSRIVQFCVTEPLETNGPRIPVTQCSTVRNFRFKAP